MLISSFDKTIHTCKIVRIVLVDIHFNGSGTLRPKTISARDSSAQIDIFTGTPRPGTPRPSIKILYLWHIVENKCIPNVVCFYFNIRFSTLGKRIVKKESIFSYKQIISCATSRSRTLRPIFKKK